MLKVGAATGGGEPVHLAVRSLVERAVLEMLTRIYRAPPGACLDPAADPMAQTVVTDAPLRPAPVYQAAYAPAAPSAYGYQTGAVLPAPAYRGR